jgi:hypothetical protein
LEMNKPSPVPTPSPPPAPSRRKWARPRWEKWAYSPEESEVSRVQPEGHKPPTICIPSAHVHSGAGQDPAQYPRTFLSEGFHPRGAIICTLFPLCKRCNNSGHLCTLEVGQQLATKTPCCCSPCKAAHLPCPSWTWFSNAFEEGNNEVLHSFQVLF